jgi:predicted Zn-dependent protease
MRNSGSILKISFVCILVFSMMSCSIMEQGAGVLSEAGLVKKDDTQSIVKTSKALRKGFGEITEEEEYYIGRAVAAVILSRYPVYENNSLTKYVNTLGNAIIVHSDRPETYAGYHFLILDSDEINAMAAPSGFIFITKGLLKRCRDEEMLAAVLAHEIGHVYAKHGLKSIKKSRLVDTFKQAVDRYGSKELAQLTGIFEEALGDIVDKLVERGYDRKYEYEADRLSVHYTVKTGYDPGGLSDFLGVMAAEAGGDSTGGWFKTHPSAKDRLKRVEKEILSITDIPARHAARTNRFKRAVKGIK